MDITEVGKSGTITLPERLRRRFEIEEGDWVALDERNDGILIQPFKEWRRSRKATHNDIVSEIPDFLVLAKATEVRKGGVIVLLKSFRSRFGIGKDVMLDETNDGILIRPVLKQSDPKDDAFFRAKTSAFETNRRRH